MDGLWRGLHPEFQYSPPKRRFMNLALDRKASNSGMNVTESAIVRSHLQDKTT
jgi:hypothetical protein